MGSRRDAKPGGCPEYLVLKLTVLAITEARVLYRAARCKIVTEGWRCNQRIRSIIIMAADVRPMIKPVQNPAGPIGSTTQSVNARMYPLGRPKTQ